MPISRVNRTFGSRLNKSHQRQRQQFPSNCPIEHNGYSGFMAPKAVSNCHCQSNLWIITVYTCLGHAISSHTLQRSVFKVCCSQPACLLRKQHITLANDCIILCSEEKVYFTSGRTCGQSWRQADSEICPRHCQPAGSQLPHGCMIHTGWSLGSAQSVMQIFSGSDDTQTLNLTDVTRKWKHSGFWCGSFNVHSFQIKFPIHSWHCQYIKNILRLRGETLLHHIIACEACAESTSEICFSVTQIRHVYVIYL